MTEMAIRKPVALLPMLDDDHVTRLYMATALFLIASFVVFIPGWSTETRMLDGANPWTKPQKFHISLGLHFITLAVLAQLLPRDVRSNWFMIIIAYLASASLVFEWLWVGLQSARAARSHYNFDTQFEALMYAGMGVGAVLMIFAALVLAGMIWWKGDRSNKGLWLGSIIGLSLGFVFTLWMAGHMSSTSRYVGAPLEGGGATVPFFGWSLEYGDLRPAHFVAMHMMQVIPFAGYMADRFKWKAVPTVLSVAGAMAALALWLFYNAQAGRPFWPL